MARLLAVGNPPSPAETVYMYSTVYRVLWTSQYKPYFLFPNLIVLFHAVFI